MVCQEWDEVLILRAGAGFNNACLFEAFPAIFADLMPFFEIENSLAA
jgi:hypothetical protein